MKLKLLLAILIIGGLLIANSAFVVDQRERAIVFRFGEIVRTDIQPGLHFKTPIVNNVRKYDARVQTMDSTPERFLTTEQKNLIIDSFVKWRIKDVEKYYVRLQGSIQNAHNRLSQQVNDLLRREVGKRTLNQVVSGDRSQIMDLVRASMEEEANALGIEVIDVRLKRVDLDQAISQQVYERMSAERKRVANELRAEGEEEAERIRANAERERDVIIANAISQAEKVRGEGDAISTDIYAQAFGQDPEFYTLYRSLEAYKKTFSNKDDMLILDASSEFFNYFKQKE